jgi:RimJ/RimL family protein N-acetyltransferase
MMEISFRRLLPADAPAYRSQRLACLREFPYQFGTDYASQMALPKLYIESQIEAQNPDVFLVGAFDQGQLIGIAGLTRDTAPHRRHIAQIIQVYVQAAYSGRRVGLRMMQALIAEAWQLGLEQLHLEVVTSSPHAIYMYGQAGFEQMGFHPNYLKIGDRYEDALLMVLFRAKNLAVTAS